MDRIKQMLPELLQKYKYVALVLLIGIVFMLIPNSSSREETANTKTEETQPQQTQTLSLSGELEQILGQIQGAGDVKVMLTVSAGEETVYQTDDNISSGSENTSTQTDTVIITDGERGQSGLVRQVNPAEYLGAIVVCQGADSPSVRLAIVEAVSDVTGLGSDRISVLKMK